VTHYNEFNELELLEEEKMTKPKPLDLKEENPYPEDIFPKITDKEWKKINELLKKELGFPLDRVAGNINRKMWNNMRDWFLERLKSAVQGLLEDINSSYGCIYHQGGNDDCIICTAIGQTLNEVQRKIKKWFPDVVIEDE